MLDELEKLGATSGEVAAALFAKGCKGRRNKYYSCPVARYLKEETGEEAMVGGGMARRGDKSCYLPPPVETFVFEFDEGKYPELIDETY